MPRRVSESLFGDEPEAEEPPPDTSAPLAERMRPRTSTSSSGSATSSARGASCGA